MNRVTSRVGPVSMLDICKADGGLVDREELRRVVEFIRAGGLKLRASGPQGMGVREAKKDDLTIHPA